MNNPLFCHQRACFCLFLAILLAMASQTTSQTSLRILFTHDLHSTLDPAAVRSDDGRIVTSGGYARLATALKQAVSANPDGTVIVDAGDLTMGTLTSMLYTTESPELLLMGKMGYDVVTLGNHDFDFGFEGLARYLTNACSRGTRLPGIVVANLEVDSSARSNVPLKDAFNMYGVRQFTILERKGLRIGIFGVLGANAANDIMIPGGAGFSDAVETARRLVKTLRDSAKVDAVICLSHTGTTAGKETEGDYRFARSVSGIDVIVSGHTHRVLRHPIIADGTVIVSAGSRSAYLGVLDVRLGPRAPVDVEHYEVIPIDSTVAPDSAVAGEIKSFDDQIDRQLSLGHGLSQHQLVATSDFDFEPIEYGYHHPGEMALGDLVADAYRYTATKAGRPGDLPIDAVIVPIGLIRGSILRGPITVADIFHVLSLGFGPDGQPGYPLITFYVTGDDLLNTFEIEATLSSLNDDIHLQVSGVRFQYNPYRVPLNRVTTAEVMDSSGAFRPIEADGLYHICVCLYSGMKIADVTAMSHGFLSIRPRRRDGTLITDLHEALVDVDSVSPGTQELKAWIALLRYLQSFPIARESGLPEMPERYRLPEGRLTSEASLNPIDLLRKPNRVTVIALSLSLGALVVVLWSLGRIVVWRRNRRV
jgi:5'-nucleotidase / UDP-sugar diphosphatase